MRSSRYSSERQVNDSGASAREVRSRSALLWRTGTSAISNDAHIVVIIFVNVFAIEELFEPKS